MTQVNPPMKQNESRTQRMDLRLSRRVVREVDWEFGISRGKFM